MKVSIFRRWIGATSPKGKSRSRRGLYRPCLEVLEERALPSSYHVTNTNDSGTGSLRQAILDANANLGADSVVFVTGLRGTIRLTSGELLITDDLTIQGPGAKQLSVSGNNASRVFEIASGLDVAISGLTITLFSPLPILPVADELVTRYESVGYIYAAATNAADNGGTPANTVDVKVYANLNGLRALRPAELTVIKQ